MSEDNKPYFVIPDVDSESFLKRMEEEENRSNKERQELIDGAFKSSKISGKRARLLREIQTSTAGSKEGVSLEKVRIALELAEHTLQQQLGEGKVAYIGAGLDWRTAIAFGATDIDMVDPDYNDSPDAIGQIIEEIKAFSEGTTEIIEDEGAIKTTIKGDFGLGEETRKINFYKKSVYEYEPSDDLLGVIEFLGPTKGYVDSSLSPTIPGIAEHLKKDAVIINYDFWPSGGVVDAGLEAALDGRAYIARNPELLKNVSIKAEELSSKMWDSLPSSSAVKE